MILSRTRKYNEAEPCHSSGFPAPLCHIRIPPKWSLLREGPGTQFNGKAEYVEVWLGHLGVSHSLPATIPESSGLVATRLFSVEWKLLTQTSDSFWFLNQRSEWVQWALKNHSKIWFWLNPFDSFWFNQPNGLPEKSSDLCHSQVLFWESKGISYSTDDSFIHGESNYWVNDSELKTA